MVEKYRDDSQPPSAEPEGSAEQPAEATPTSEPGTQALPILPLRGTVVFPMTLVPLAAGQPRSLRLIDEVVSGNRMVGMVLQRDATQEAAGPGETFGVGTTASIHQRAAIAA